VSLSVLHSYVFARDLRPLPAGTHLMLDSGGFSAFTMGIKITVAELAAWYRTVDAEVYAALDVIYDPAASRRNALEMRELGVDCTPAVHAGTSPEEVDRLAGDGFTSVALGGMVSASNARSHADAWAHACLDRAAFHGLKVHGFGLAASSARRLPVTMRFTSVDASTWLADRYAKDTRLWDGAAYRPYNLNRQRLAAAALMRHWPGEDWTRALMRPHGTRTNPEAGRLLKMAGAASMLAFGDWLMARGGPRIYLASYLNNMYPPDDQPIIDLLAAISPAKENA
jgi:hypothetical protein